jgi:hypothetical protein
MTDEDHETFVPFLMIAHRTIHLVLGHPTFHHFSTICGLLHASGKTSVAAPCAEIVLIRVIGFIGDAGWPAQSDYRTLPSPMSSSGVSGGHDASNKPFEWTGLQ